MKNERLFQWFISLEADQIHLSHNDHHSEYASAAEEFAKPRLGNPYKDVTAGLRDEMIATDSIWRLQIYPVNAAWSRVWYGPTIESVLRQAKSEYDLIEWACNAMRLADEVPEM